MLTVTLQHHKGERLADVLGVLREGWKRTKAGAGGKASKAGLRCLATLPLWR